MRALLILLMFICSNSFAQISFSELLAEKYIPSVKKVTPQQVDSLHKTYPNDDTLSIVLWHIDTSYTSDQVYQFLYKIIREKNTKLAYYSLAQDYWNDQKIDSAKKWNDAYLKYCPNNEESLTLKAWIYYRKEMFPRAIALLNQLEKKFGKTAKRTAQKGIAYIGMKNQSRASLLFDEALREDSSCYPALQGALNIYLEVKANQQVIEIGKQLLKIDSLNLHYLNSVGLAYMNTNQHEKSIPLFKQILSISPNELSAIESLTMSYHATENMDSMCRYQHLLLSAEIINDAHLKYNEERIRKYSGYCNPEVPDYYYQRGIAAYNLGQFENAIDHYNRGIKKFPNHFYSYNFKGNAYMALQKYKEAAYAFDQAIEILNKNNHIIPGTPQHMKDGTLNFIAITYYSAAECYANLYNETKSREYIIQFEQQFGEGPNETIGSKYNALATLAFNKGDYKTGFEYLEKTYSTSKFIHDDYRTGLQLATKIYEINTSNPFNIYTLGVKINNKRNPLIQKTGVYQLKKELNPGVKMDRAYQIINELKMKYPSQGEAYILEAFFNKELGKPYCDNIKALNTLGFPILQDPYWEHCK